MHQSLTYSRHAGNKRPWNRAAYTTIDDLEELFFKPWIRRVWIYQVILLASEPVVVCGEFHIDWHTLERGLLLLSLRTFELTASRWIHVAQGRGILHLANGVLRIPAVSNRKRHEQVLRNVGAASHAMSIVFALITVTVQAVRESCYAHAEVYCSLSV
jgi:hypothetical protein